MFINCRKCKGLGRINVFVFRDVTGIINKTINVECPKCRGTGSSGK